MTTETTRPPRPDVAPDLLLEASRVFYAAGRRWLPLSGLVSNMAVEATAPTTADEGAPAKPAVDPQVDPKIVAAIRCDAAALRLNNSLPHDPARALELLEPVDPPSSEDDGRRVFALRAMANGQLYKMARAQGQPKEELTERVEAVRLNLAAALANPVNDAVLSRLRALWNPSVPSSRDDPEDDLQLVVAENPSVLPPTVDRSETASATEPPSASPSPRTPPPAESPP